MHQKPIDWKPNQIGKVSVIELYPWLNSWANGQSSETHLFHIILLTKQILEKVQIGDKDRTKQVKSFFSNLTITQQHKTCTHFKKKKLLPLNLVWDLV